MNSPRAGQPAQPSDLVDVAALVTAYYTREPDPEDVDQQVAFGTSGHRGSSLRTSFNEAHILATTQAICEYRVDRASTAPSSSAGTRTACPSPPGRRPSRCWRPTTSRCSSTPATATRPPRRSRTPSSRPTGARSLGSTGCRPAPDSPTASSSRRRTTRRATAGSSTTHPHGGPADSDATKVIAARANELIRGGLADVRRVPFARARAAATAYDFLGSYVDDLANVLDIDAIRDAGIRIGADPLGGAAVDYWGAIADRHRLDLTVVNPLVDATWRFMTLDWDGKIRMDCSSPSAMAGLIEQRDVYDIATGNDADADRHGVVTPDAGLMNPNHYLSVAIQYLYGGARPEWRDDGFIGKTLVSSSMIDRVAADLGRTLVEVPVGFKWFVPGLLDGSGPFGGEESAGASFLRRDGSVWTTDKDGILLALLASEILARTGKSPSEHYRSLVERHGEPAYARIDAAATREEKARLGALTPDAVTAESLAGEPITAKLTEAPGNGAAIGGLKVVTESAWFAARPSGTEDVYKIYAESFRGPEHLAQVQAEAKDVVSAALGS